MNPFASLSAYPATADRLLRELAVIPAPTGQETQRIAFCQHFLEENGFSKAFTDAVGNLILPFGDIENGPLDVFAAHADVVFPDMEALPWSEDETFIRCPGIGDNTAHVAALLMTALALKDREPQEGGVLIVINVAEEGLGNLKGSRQLMADYGDRMRSFVTLDSIFPEVVTTAVGSCRYRISVKTEGGHSFRDYGKTNAAERLAALIEKLYSEPLPSRGRTTRNVGIIEGGTSVNTIAEDAAMLFEYRSDDREDLAEACRQLEKAAEALRSEDCAITVTLIGERPCGRETDPVVFDRMKQRAMALVRQYYHEEPFENAGSTDANAALAAGVPALCFGACRGGGVHTREEWIRKDSLLPGLCLAYDLVAELF
ncbi:MAG: M20/M25/M40 family metallo-hydrolase [Lachnospiraceae bacterium]|nr:M20/M25/M40 family metallo-hydrolase [Lachnospiraceae bacterium]